jgi:hypothetical protein
MSFEILGEFEAIELIAKGLGIRERECLWKAHGRAVWRKMKGNTRIKLNDGTIHKPELHWYEAHGLGKKEFKIKRLLD